MAITDKQRIDFLERMECEISFDRYGGEEKFIVKPSEWDGGDWKPTVRKAIDSAIWWNKHIRSKEKEGE